jgi:hypothetical protein
MHKPTTQRESREKIDAQHQASRIVPMWLLPTALILWPDVTMVGARFNDKSSLQKWQTRCGARNDKTTRNAKHMQLGAARKTEKTMRVAAANTSKTARNVLLFGAVESENL